MATTYEEEYNEETWDKKKIIISFLVVLALILAVSYETHILSFQNKKIVFHSPFQPQEIQRSVAGISTLDQQPTISVPKVSFNLSLEAQKKLDELKNELQNLNVSEMATSTPQVQKILSDIKELQTFPASEAKNVCQKICNNF